MLEISLLTILLAVLVLPVSLHAVEKNIEAFLLAMGAAAVTVWHYFGPERLWSVHLAGEIFREPVLITAVVFAAGFLILFFKDKITKYILKAEELLGKKLFSFALIVLLGFSSSVITAIMAAILLVEIVSALRYDREHEIKLVVLGCFSIGLGAVLTPVGEPLSTICIAKLRGAPYNADFFFLLKHLSAYVVPGIVLCGAVGAMIAPKGRSDAKTLGEKETENIRDVFIRAGKVYIFIMALILLGTGFKPIIDQYIIKLSSSSLYWINSLSAVMDNATLASAEISPKMELVKIQFILLGLLIAGGMLVPGNIPNIISAGRLKIKSKEWAKMGLPFGFVMMGAYFAVLRYIL